MSHEEFLHELKKEFKEIFEEVFRRLRDIDEKLFELNDWIIRLDKEVKRPGGKAPVDSPLEKRLAEFDRRLLTIEQAGNFPKYDKSQIIDTDLVVEKMIFLPEKKLNILNEALSETP